MVHYMKVVDSTTASNSGWLHFLPFSTRNSLKNRIFEYGYLDRGIRSTDTNIRDFTSIKYIILDGQQVVSGPAANLSSAYLASVDHMLVRISANTLGDSFFFGSTSYFLMVIDGGV